MMVKSRPDPAHQGTKGIFVVIMISRPQKGTNQQKQDETSRTEDEVDKNGHM